MQNNDGGGQRMVSKGQAMTVVTLLWTVLWSFWVLPVTGTSCPGGLLQNWPVRQRGGLCYQFINHELQWTKARSFCQYREGYLAEVPDNATQNYLVSSLHSLNWNREGVWIGATDSDREGTWVWDTGE
ncbi:hypothetical protein ACOMHN_036710 [Nucella lapillus]